MCIFHEALKACDANQMSVLIVALSGYEKDRRIFEKLRVSALAPVAAEPERYLNTLLSFPADKGKGREALEALEAQLPAGEYSHNIESDMRAVLAEVNHCRPEFLHWFKENPPSLQESRAILLVSTMALEILQPSRPQEVKRCCQLSP